MELLLSPPILFFFLGGLATLMKSDLEVPKSVARLLSLYLLMSIGLYGGYKLAVGGIDGQAMAVMGVATASSFVLPFVAYAVLRWRLGAEDAAAIAATFGSISAVTFVTAVAFLDNAGVSYSGYLVASMALMESPAIVSGVLLARLAAGRARRRELESSGGGASASADDARTEWGELFREAGLNGAVVLLVGAMVIGYVTGERGWASVSAFVYDPFKGVLCLFLLDMGLLAARRVGDLRRAGVFLVGFGVVWALVQGLIGVGAAVALGLDRGDALLLAILFGSASYIAVPAALRLALPGANPSLYIPLALGITFPFNIVVGIPMYYALLGWLGLEASVGG
ncbi:MAG: sodium-dependent bicarbonate transport family permease [Planctomycetota bacterium]